MSATGDLLVAMDLAGATVVACDWPNRGCGQPIRKVTTRRGKTQVVNATPVGKIIVVEVEVVGYDHEPDQVIDPLFPVGPAGHDCARLGCRPVRVARSRVVDGWRDHHADCPPWLALHPPKTTTDAGRTRD
jgi:hypothetical protein